VPRGPALRVSALCLFLHILVTASISGRILVRAIHRWLSLSTLNGQDVKALGIHFAISFVVLVSAGLMAIVIPAFDNFTSLIGSLTLPFLAYGFPAVFFICAMRAKKSAIPTGNVVLLAVFFCFLALLVVLGTMSTIENMIQTWQGGSTLC